VEASGRCLLVVGTERRWSDAELHCRSLGGRLASVLSADDPVVTTVDQQTSTSRRVWIGLHKTRADWQYATGTSSLIRCFLKPSNNSKQKVKVAHTRLPSVRFRS